VKTDGRQPGQGRPRGQRGSSDGQPECGGGQPESNVVRLPVDWLGPRDELVPFGPAVADREGADRDPGREGVDREGADREGADRERLESSVVELTPSSPSPAEGFWGEDSDAIQDALQGPAVTPAPPPACAGDDARVACAPAATARRLRTRMHRPPLRRAHAGNLIVAGTIAIACGGLAIRALGEAPGGHPGGAPLRAASGAGRTLSLRIPEVLARVPTRARASGSGHLRRVMLHRDTRRRGRAAASSPAPAANADTYAAYHHSVAPSASGQTVQAPAAPSGEGTPSTRAGPEPGPGGGDSRPAGPVGPSAPFGPGLLG